MRSKADPGVGPAKAPAGDPLLVERRGGPFVLIVEDEDAVLRGLSRFFSPRYTPRTAGTVADASAILESTDDFAGAVIDVRLPDGSGLEVLRQIRTRGRSWPILVLTGFFEKPHAKFAQLFGAEFLPKPAEPQHLDAFARRMGGYEGTWAARQAALIESFAREHQLTARERQVLTMAVDDQTRQEMMEHLHLSYGTIKSHSRTLLRKTKQNNLTDLARMIRRMIRGDVVGGTLES